MLVYLYENKDAEVLRIYIRDNYPKDFRKKNSLEKAIPIEDKYKHLFGSSGVYLEHGKKVFNLDMFADYYHGNEVVWRHIDDYMNNAYKELFKWMKEHRWW